MSFLGNSRLLHHSMNGQVCQLWTSITIAAVSFHVYKPIQPVIHRKVQGPTVCLFFS